MNHRNHHRGVTIIKQNLNKKMKINGTVEALNKRKRLKLSVNQWAEGKGSLCKITRRQMKTVRKFSQYGIKRVLNQSKNPMNMFGAVIKMNQSLNNHPGVIMHQRKNLNLFSMLGAIVRKKKNHKLQNPNGLQFPTIEKKKNQES